MELLNRWWCLRDVCRFATCLCTVWFTQSGERNKWHGRMNTAGKKLEGEEQRAIPHTAVGQYKTSLQECHRKFVHFLLHLAAILLDKHHSHLLVLSISLKKPSQTGTHHFQPPGPHRGKTPSGSLKCTFACLCQRAASTCERNRDRAFPTSWALTPTVNPIINPLMT